MIPEQQLDFVLSYIKPKIQVDAVFNENYIWSLYVSRTPETGITRTMLGEILKKLIKDGYIREHGTNPITYLITFEGLIFEGYELEKEIKNIEKIKIEKLEERQKRNEAHMLYLTVVLAISAFCSVPYYILEISNNTNFVLAMPYFAASFLILSIGIFGIILILLIKEIRTRK